MPNDLAYLKCITDYLKYRDTALVLSALKKLVEERPDVGSFVGVEYTLESADGRITPDLSAVSSNGVRGLLFELKWSVTPSSVRSELLDVKRYLAPFKAESVSTVERSDVVLVCHADDAEVIVSAVHELAKLPENQFLKEPGFAIWSWSLSIPKGTGAGEVDQMRMNCAYGATLNRRLENLIQRAGGIVTSAEVLRFLRNKYLFTKEKPPVQYTMAVLLLHVFTSFQDDTNSVKEFRLTMDMVEMVYERARTFFPGWKKASSETIQARKEWIREAIRQFLEIGISGVKLPLPRTKRQVQETLCDKIGKNKTKRGRVMKTVPRTLASGKETKLTDYWS